MTDIPKKSKITTKSGIPLHSPFHGLSKSLQTIQQDQLHNGYLGLDPDTIINNEADKKEETKETKKQED